MMNIWKFEQGQGMKERCRTICFWCLLIGIVLKLLYATAVPFNISKHDLGGYVKEIGETGNGHLGYIQYLSFFHAYPTDFGGQFYHPPLFHIVGACIYSLVATSSERIPAAFETIQFVNMLFACVTVLLVWRIFQKLLKNPLVQCACTAAISFAPLFFNLGVVLNNDCLMTMLLVLSFYCTLRWNENPTMGRIVAIALAFAGAILTKTSGILLAPAIACVFLVRLLRDKDRRGQLIRQYLVFAVICIPLGISWSVREKLLFGMEFGYIPRMLQSNKQYIGEASLWKRLLIPDKRQFLSSQILWDTPGRYVNIWAQTLLTMTIDEGFGFASKGVLRNLVLLLNQLWGMLHVVNVVMVGHLGLLAVKRRKSEGTAVRLLLFAGYAVILVSYIVFSLRYPFICTMNARYIALTPIIGIVCSGMFFDEGEEGIPERKGFEFWCILIAMVSLLSSLVYLAGTLLS